VKAALGILGAVVVAASTATVLCAIGGKGAAKAMGYSSPPPDPRRGPIYILVTKDGGHYTRGPRTGEDYPPGTPANLDGRIIVFQTRGEAESFTIGTLVVELPEAPSGAIAFEELREKAPCS
jgi:hypothetical protein